MFENINLPWLEKSLILYAWSGSTAYGTRTEDSDDDMRGIAVPSKQYYYGLERFDQYRCEKPDDIEVKSIREYFRLALDGNPNVLEWLFTDPKFFITINQFGQELVNIRQQFLSKQFFKKVSGFAKGQKHEMENDGRNNRGQGSPKRIADRIKYGFDVRSASHLIRIDYEGIEVMETGNLTTYRPEKERKLLVDIKTGKLTKQEVLDIHDELDARLYQAYLKTDLPENPDYHKINKFLIELTEEHFNEKN
jgi:predicted nucleotidyltransferase